MSAPTDGTHNDGGLIFGSQLVTIPVTTGKEYTAKNIKLSRPVTIIESHDILGQPMKEVMVPGNFTGTMTLSIVDATTPAPAMGAHFTIVPHGVASGTVIHCKVAQPDEAFDQHGEGTFEVNFRKYLNPPT